MKTTLKISQTVIKRISDTIKPCHGKLYGTLYKNSLSILGLQVDIDSGDNLVYSLPAEVDFCGIFSITDDKVNQSWIREYAGDVDVTDNPVYIEFNLETKQISTYTITNDKIEVLPYTTITENDIYSQFIHLRLQGNISLQCEANAKSVEEAFEGLRKLITSGVMGFGFEKLNVYLLGNDYENPIIGLSGESIVAELCDESNGENEGISRKKKSQAVDMQIVNVNLLKRTTKQDSGIEIKTHAPICILDKKQTTVINVTVELDSLSIVGRQTKVSRLYVILVESAIRNLKLYESVLLNNLRENEDNKKSMRKLETFHFNPSECGHFITRIYPRNCNENVLRKERQLLHEELLVTVQMPRFRRANRFIFRNSSSKGSIPLVNPHESVKNTDNGGQVSLVKGKYQYFHYCQDKMDDNGWGCAYRSLQTLASWFKLQGFVDKEVSTFKEIQKCLVDIGDKPKDFIDSRQWIGSTEVSFVLNTLLGITSKILFVNSGDEMSSKGPELISHFEHHGSPIMIGGGVLAHTILGVDYNRETGILKFLILDPHYTGGEDLQVIVNKGWCGWKNSDFWDKTAHYNMCMPQVPREI